jgi:hypothetical protein
MAGTDLPADGGNSQIQQDVGNNRGQAIAQMIGGMAIGQLTVYFSQNPTESAVVKPDTSKLGANPYRGLLAFTEMDGDRFFGRQAQIEQLLQKFCDLHDEQSTVRVLPIYGPSGSGKSSLARAGLIPALGKKPLQGRDRSRVVVLIPGTHPLEALATVLARIATNDPAPVAKSQEFEQILAKNDKGKYEGLRRIADTLPDIASSPLIVLVDQFEEVYTYARSTDQTERKAFIAERDALIENLLCAAAERSKGVCVILTLRSDFLGDTQKHPHLNKLFSSQGFLVPIMQPDELESAITEPAAQAGYQLDKEIVQRLIGQTEGQKGSLPLLQFALTRIWEGLQNGVEPAETLHNIGGVGGSLAGEAQRLYQSLKPEDQAIARSIFLALVQVNEDSADTRRRAPVSELIPSDGDENRVWSIINKFADPGVRFLATFSDKQHGEMIEMIEVAHEALIRNWGQLKEWLKECRQDLRKKRKIEEAAEDWRSHQKSKDYLIQERSLRDAREFMQGATKETALSSLAVEFVKASHRKKQEGLIKIVSLSLIFPLIGSLVTLHFYFINRAQTVLRTDDCKQNTEVRSLLEYMLFTGQSSHLEEIKLCNENLPDIKLQKAVLWKADFKRTILANADFQEAFMEEADFRGAYLYNANFQYASLKDAKFEGSIVFQADFRNSQDITDNQLVNSKLCQTKLPENIHLDPNRDCQVIKK